MVVNIGLFFCQAEGRVKGTPKNQNSDLFIIELF